MEKNKKQVAKISVFITSIFIIFISISYAFINLTLQGTKRQVIQAGTLSLRLEEYSEITITDALPMYDEVGMIQEEAYDFELINDSSYDTNYQIIMAPVETGTLALSDIRYGLVKDGVTKIDYLSNLEDYIIDEGTITGGDSYSYTMRLWIRYDLEEITQIQTKFMSFRMNLKASQEVEESEVNLKEVLSTKAQTPTTVMFNYTSEGVDPMDVANIEATNGVYVLDDDDGESYFYRGIADNLVQFGNYGSDYYVYAYGGYEFVTLAACKAYNSSCAESNKTLKYQAGTPMYWRVVRINGDDTIRMIYSGTTPDASGVDTAVGFSRYSTGYNSDGSTAYTVGRNSSETNSMAKDAVDAWYSSAFSGTVYENDIVTGKFCSDSSGYEKLSTYISTFAAGSGMYVFNSFKNNYGNIIQTKDSSPSFKCPETTASYGGSYNLKAGLLTLDELTAAGGQAINNTSYYLYDGTVDESNGIGFWTMTPTGYTTDSLTRAIVNESNPLVATSYNSGYLVYGQLVTTDLLIRPVINLRADIRFVGRTDGSVLTPYEVVR